MQTYLVGGAIRDQLLGLEPKDRDWVIVGASSADVGSLLALGYEQVGADFPVFLHPTTKEEYALARIERKVGDGYHGFTVETDGVTLEQDLLRRDLTINSMATAFGTTGWGGTLGGLIDPYGGYSDLKKGVLRHTSPAFAEDPLRVLRVARFAARWAHFTVAPETDALCRRLVAEGALDQLSNERIFVELRKGMSEARPSRMFELLTQWDAFSKVRLLRDLLGTGQGAHIPALLQASDALPVSERYLTVLTLLNNDLLNGRFQSAAPTASAISLRALLARILSFNEVCVAGCMLEILNRTGAFHTDRLLNELCALLATLQQIKHPLPFTALQLRRALEVAQVVTAANYPDRAGKELGDAIQTGRRNAIVLGVPL